MSDATGPETAINAIEVKSVASVIRFEGPAARIFPIEHAL
jgi:hypothetical protein|tara:strand:+ start:606 stop:725 length:120 start_codon:yes stop_codon:yes gene_type:complete